MQVKMGHGGTLDPMATGVLILGVGSGTKSLNSFLECTKSYECVVLFGAATDSYDAVGKIVARKDYSHITKEIVEEALGKFRGRIMQKPPIFSALKVNGKKMYEYAREGKELPIEIVERPVEVKELEMVEWMDGETHGFGWPVEEAEKKEKEVVDKVLKLEDEGADTGLGAKRKREEGDDASGPVEQKGILPSPKRVKSSPEPTMSGALPGDNDNADSALKGESTQTAPQPTPTPCPAPACRLRMTVTSGFYVRSLAHDLGAAVGSLALMSSLVRSRQGDFTLGENVLDYDDLEKGEEVWGRQVEIALMDWESKAGERENAQRPSSEARAGPWKGGGSGGRSEEGQGKKRAVVKKSGTSSPKKRRRNSSSPESGAGDSLLLGP